MGKEARNAIPVDALIKRVVALKLTPEAIVRRFARTGCAAAVDAVWRHCHEAESPSEERVAAADFVRFVEAD